MELYECHVQYRRVWMPSKGCDGWGEEPLQRVLVHHDTDVPVPHDLDSKESPHYIRLSAAREHKFLVGNITNKNDPIFKGKYLRWKTRFHLPYLFTYRLLEFGGMRNNEIK